MPRRPLTLLILLLAAALRFYRIDHQSFWNDEGNSARIAERSVEKILAGAAGDIHPPGYYLALAGWRALAGHSELALRGFSALAGIVLVALVYRLGTAYLGETAALFAALLAAVHPFLVYYSQEARMYSLAAALGAATFWIASCFTFHASHNFQSPISSLHTKRLALAYILTVAAGLYTHYSFAFILIAVNLAALWQITSAPSAPSADKFWQQATVWVLLQLGALLLFLPWLPTAWQQVTTWPAARAYQPLFTSLTETWRWLTYGPTIQTAAVVPGLVAFAILALAGLAANRRGVRSLPTSADIGRCRTPQVLLVSGYVIQPLLWLLVPTGLTLAFGLFTETFAKFLIVAAPAVCLLAGRGIAKFGISNLQSPISNIQLPITLLATLTAAWFTFASLSNLYADPTYFRADYRAMAADVEAVARPGDAILLNAPNQWEVFTYYHPDDSNVYPVARSRPLDVPAQIAELEQIIATHDRLFVLYWGDAQSDPGRVIESWLNEHTFKAYDRWYSDVRLSAYAVPTTATALDTRTDATFGESIILEGFALNATEFAPGDILQLTLFWRAQSPIPNRYKVFVHVYGDPLAPPVAQQDGEPGGGLMLTTTWQPGETVADNHGVFLPLDLPAGEYQLAIGLYGVEDGVRLPVTMDGQSVGDNLPMGKITLK